MLFRNLKLFRLTNGFPSATQLSAKLASATLMPCGVMTPKTSGWVPPRGQPGELIVSVQGHHLVTLGTEQKLLPGGVVKKHLEEKVKEVEAQQGYRPGRKQIRELKDVATSELLAKAFTKHNSVSVWLDIDSGWMGIDSPSSSKVDDVIEHLKITLGDLPVRVLNTAIAPHAAMTNWLATGEAPARFSIDQDCELREASERRATVRYTRHTLDGDDIRPHLQAGKRVTQLALTWNDRISFVLTEDFAIKRLTFLDVIKEESAQAEEASEQFESDLVIMAGEIKKMMADLVLALGGEVVESD